MFERCFYHDKCQSNISLANELANEFNVLGNVPLDIFDTVLDGKQSSMTSTAR